VFADELGRALLPDRVSRAFARAVLRTKLPAIRLHDLRHTFATVALGAGVDTLYVSELLGHSSPAITMNVYQHTREDRLAQAAQQVGDAVFAVPGANRAQT
jgi:integrase